MVGSVFVCFVTIGIVCLIMSVSIFSFEKEHVFWFLFLGLVPSILGHNTQHAVKYLSLLTAVASILGRAGYCISLVWLYCQRGDTNHFYAGAPFIFLVFIL